VAERLLAYGYSTDITTMDYKSDKVHRRRAYVTAFCEPEQVHARISHTAIFGLKPSNRTYDLQGTSPSCATKLLDFFQYKICTDPLCRHLLGHLRSACNLLSC